MNNLAQSEVFSLTLVIGTYMAALALYKKTRISLLHPLLTSILVIIAVLKMMGIEYESFQRGSHLIHFLLGPSVVALGFVLYEQMQYLKGNVISILTSVFVGAIIGIVSVIVIGDLMGADQALIATLQPKSVTTPIAMGVPIKPIASPLSAPSTAPICMATEVPSPCDDAPNASPLAIRLSIPNTFITNGPTILPNIPMKSYQTDLQPISE